MQEWKARPATLKQKNYIKFLANKLGRKEYSRAFYERLTVKMAAAVIYNLKRKEAANAG